MTAAPLSSAARRDLLQAMQWIAKDNPDAARALQRGVIKAAMTIAEHPYVGGVRLDLVHPPYRFVSVVGFPYLIVYHADRRPPLIVRILHGARDLPEILRDL